MKKSMAIIVLVLIASYATARNGSKSVNQSKGSITFVVDENLSPIDNNYPMEQSLEGGSEALRKIFRDEGVPGDTHAMIAWSFSDDEQFYTFTGKDVFFKTIRDYDVVLNTGQLAAPLIVVNGEIFNVTQKFDFANAHKEDFAELLGVEPDDIKDITVFKDAAATAVWGEKGKWGVIEIKTKGNHKKTKRGGERKIKIIKGTVSDEAGPLWGATVCEVNDKGRIVASAVTDENGKFTMKVLNPQDRLRFSYVGMKTVTRAIDKKKYKIKMQSVPTLRDLKMQKRQSGPSTLPIPIKEISMPNFEELGIVEGEEGVLNENNPRVQINLSDEEQTLVTPVNDLGFNMFRKVGTSESILLSPLGMTYALGLINNGAAGRTQQEITTILTSAPVSSPDGINRFCRKMLTEAPRIDKLTTMKITNEFFSPKSYELKPAFTKVAKDSYETEFKELESDLLNFILVNTIYFNGVWTDKFPKGNTKDEVFKGEDGKKTTVPMMNQIHQFFYTENDLCQALCLPYSNGAYQMIVLLPKEGKTVQKVAQSLTADSWEKMYDQMRRVDVDVKLPRFESSSEVNLTSVMSALMPNAFDMEKADFKNLFGVMSCIEKIKQLGCIKVDETGTEATVATILQGRIAGLGGKPPKAIRFHATHPFLYLVREWSTGTIFFIGQYMGT